MSGGQAVTSNQFIPNAGFSVTGSFANNGTLTITDSSGSLGNKTTANPQWWFDYAQGSLTNNTTYSASPNSFTFGSGVNTFVSSGSSIYLPSAASGGCFYDLTQAGPQEAGPAVDVLGNGATSTVSTQIYRFLVRCYNYSPGVFTNYNTNLKSLRLWSGYPVSGGSQNNGWIAENCDNSGLGTPGGGVIGWETTLTSGFFGGFLPTVGNFYTVEDEFQNPSSLNTATALRHYIRNGVCVKDPTMGYETATTGTPGMMTMHVLDQISNNGEPSGAGVISTWDYSDNTWQRIMWSTESSWQLGTGGTSQNRMIQIPLSWATSSGTSTVQFLNLFGMFTNLSGLYLYVVNSSGVGTQIGYHT